ncbi:MAG: type II toxin-antitoxin system HicB family antitoxin [Candidatus Moranbacteria bacterium]|jgi:predicted RNase H-like HicB family nuclease|nr:type II toxin-antitoxin system HicB family antitoxin [Candidatus Moranbacteria bacterium]
MKPLTFEIERDGNEFHTWCPELPGCHTHGKTVTQAMENLKEAVQLYLEVIMEEQIALKSIELAS